jgi:hypothetical protein
MRDRCRHRTTIGCDSLFLIAGLLLTMDPVVALVPGQPAVEAYRNELVLDWDILPMGLVAVYYHRAGGSAADSVTLHRVLQQGFDGTARQDLERSFGPQVTILSVELPESPVPYYYFIVTSPLYYGTTLDSDGYPATLWLDRQEDGLNGNERTVDPLWLWQMPPAPEQPDSTAKENT